MSRHPLFRSRRGLPPELVEAQEYIQKLGRSYGLDFCPIIFEMCDYDEINMIASYGGFPTRYPHWRFGMEYLQMQKGYEYGLQKIYEMVINTNPSYAYLLDNNTMVDQKLVMAHVLGHVDFFTNNAWFAHTNRKMLDQMANHAARVRRYIDRHGADTVEAFIDMCLSIEDLIDPYAPYVPRPVIPEEDSLEDLTTDEVYRLPVSQRYMSRYINPPEYLAEQRKKQTEERQRTRSFPEQPERDVMGFILRYGRLSRWQQDVLSIIRDEAYYFAPQGMTKIMNEGWACVAADTPVFTERGLLTMQEVVEGEARRVSDGVEVRDITARNIIPDHPTVTITTRRGLVLTGSNNHRILREDGTSWARLDALAVGDQVKISGGAGLWPEAQVPITWTQPVGFTLEDAAREAGVSVSTLMRFRAGRRVQQQSAVAMAVECHETQQQSAISLNRRAQIQCPETVDEDLGAFLGYLVGDGHISRVKRVLGLTTGDADQAERFAALAHRLFGLRAVIQQDEGRLRVLLHSEALSDLLTLELGLTDDPSADRKTIPRAILRSPQSVVRAFLRAYFDADGHAGAQGVILSTTSEKMGQQVQLLLLNHSILSRRRLQGDGCWHVHITGASAKTFSEQIGFNLERKQDALRRYVSDRRWFKRERASDEIVSIEHGSADVYDITVEETHRYAAAGLINHNSFWHTRLMTRHILDDSEVITYADHHSGTVTMRPGQLNPYKIGIELFRDIEERWNRGQHGKGWLDCEDVARKRDWDTGAGRGMDKVFEVRRNHNDVTFIDTFLTEDFVRKVGLFTYEYDASAGHYLIESRDFQAVKSKLLSMLSNRGQPRIHVTDGNHSNRGELELTHQHEGMDIQLEWAESTMGNIARLWGRPVHLKTRVDDGEVTLHHDGDTFKAEGLKERGRKRRG
jgi:stage V sporulation protein R